MHRNSFRPYLLLIGTSLLSLLAVPSIAPRAKDAREVRIASQQVESFSVIGIAARTSNAREEGPDGIIPKQWQRFFQEGVRDQIPHRIGKDIYAVYTTYASDHNGEYTYLLGVKVEHGTAPPAGMVAVDVPAGSYAVLTSDKGPLRQVVPAAWKRIFQLEDGGKIRRAYRSDFEVYDQRSANPEDAQIDIFLGVK